MTYVSGKHSVSYQDCYLLPKVNVVNVKQFQSFNFFQARKSGYFQTNITSAGAVFNNL